MKETETADNDYHLYRYTTNILFTCTRDIVNLTRHWGVLGVR